MLIEAGDENYSEISQKFYEGKIIGDPITDLSASRLRQFGGTSGHWGGWSKPMEKYNFDLWPLNANDLDIYLKRTCEILNINNQFRKSSLNEFFNQIEFQYSTVGFADKFKNHISKSNNIFLVLNTQLSHFVGSNNNTDYAVCISNSVIKKIRANYFVLACGGIENIHEHRLNLRWLIRRSFRLGVLGHYIDISLYGKFIGFIINYLKW